ncbi:esterase/lipase family protein [uncultured Microbacterium sp.]|uniref:esterase/lipase family protein n=1 Tax=uncultured Microbacterium sp. TaxID=191216 RepID=UPI0035C9726E
MTPGAPALTRGSRVQQATWWAADYAYAAWRQLAILAPPWGTGGRRRTPSSWAEGSAELPEVVLLPGVYEHWTFLRPLADDLNAAGHRICVVHGMGANTRGIVETADRLARALARTPPPAAGRVLVAHSKGGLIGKHLLIASGAAQAAVREAAAGGDPAEAAASAPAPASPDQPEGPPLGVIGMVAVCTPFGGSPLAGLMWVPSIRAFLPSDETIVSLGRDTSVNGRIVSVFGRFDPHIPGGSVLDGATNILVSGAGHFRVLGLPETYRAVRDGIALLAAPS